MIMQSTREATREELIQRINELQLEIEELKQDNSKQWKERCKLSFEVDDSIPKQKIKLELEKVTNEIKEVEKKQLKARTIHNQELWRCVLIRLDERIKVYEELLK